MSSVSRRSASNCWRWLLRAGLAAGQIAGPLHCELARLAALNAASSSGVRLVERAMGVIDLDPHIMHETRRGVNPSPIWDGADVVPAGLELVPEDVGRLESTVQRERFSPWHRIAKLANHR